MIYSVSAVKTKKHKWMIGKLTTAVCGILLQDYPDLKCIRRCAEVEKICENHTSFRLHFFTLSKNLS